MSVVTMMDVAQAAKVSRTTVSMVLNGTDEKWRISDKTREHILSTAERLGYRKNLIARSMVTGRTNVIGIVGTLDHSFGADILRGISEIAGNDAYSIKYFRGETNEELAEIAKACVGQRLSGVISHIDEFDSNLSSELSGAKIPMVHVDNIFPDALSSCVCSDDFSGAEQVVEHLYNLGHRKISYVTTALNHLYAKIRYDGFLAGMEKYGLKFDNTQLGLTDFKTEITNDFRKIIAKIINSEVTAVFCSGDPLAVKVLKIAVEDGIKIPEELSIVGFADLDYAQWSVPALTTVRQPFVEMGRVATKILLSEINDKAPCRKIKLPIELVVRQSTAKVPSEKHRNKKG